MIKAIRFFLFLSIFLFLIFTRINEAADIIEARLDEVVKVFETYFPKTEGRVTSAGSSNIRINIGRNKGASSRNDFVCFKRGQGDISSCYKGAARQA